MNSIFKGQIFIITNSIFVKPEVIHSTSPFKLRSQKSNSLNSSILVPQFLYPHLWHQTYGRDNLERDAYNTNGVNSIPSTEHFTDQPESPIPSSENSSNKRGKGQDTQIPETAAISASMDYSLQDADGK